MYYNSTVHQLEDKWICKTCDIEIKMSEVIHHKYFLKHEVYNTLGKGLAARIFKITPRGYRYYWALKCFERALDVLMKLPPEQILEMAKIKKEEKILQMIDAFTEGELIGSEKYMKEIGKHGKTNEMS